MCFYNVIFFQKINNLMLSFVFAVLRTNVAVRLKIHPELSISSLRLQFSYVHAVHPAALRLDKNEHFSDEVCVFHPAVCVCPQAAIRKELNEFKSREMEVHEDSKHFTRYWRAPLNQPPPLSPTATIT